MTTLRGYRNTANNNTYSTHIYSSANQATSATATVESTGTHLISDRSNLLGLAATRTHLRAASLSHQTATITTATSNSMPVATNNGFEFTLVKSVVSETVSVVEPDGIPQHAHPSINQPQWPIFTQDPFRAAELAIELQTERLKVAEALAARDLLVHRLGDAYTSLQQKNQLLGQVGDKFVTKLTDSTNLPTHGLTIDHNEKKALTEQIAAQQTIINQLKQEIKALKPPKVDPPPCYEENLSPTMLSPSCQNEGEFYPFPSVRANWNDTPTAVNYLLPPPLSRSVSQCSVPTTLSDIGATDVEECEIADTLPKAGDAVDRIRARNAILAALAVPLRGPPDDLQPIMIPAPLTLQEFINSGSSFIRTALSNYRQLHELTTSWCEEREEHGYFLAPVFKCSTNPRVTTAHRWNTVDVLHKMSKPTDFFYNKNGHWYYAGVYKAFRMEDLTTKEWDALSTETTSAIVKDTILARRNSSPQNIYEVTQLYTCGALKVACIGLQCVGFNLAVFHALLDHATKYAHAAMSSKNGTSAPCSRSDTPLHSPVPTSGGVFPWSTTPINNAVAGLTERIANLSMNSPGTDDTSGSIKQRSA
ncbi:hypothetical protein EYR36_000127 [Pleurotus pulmonarius]|nr:hypothetical protein EYR36_000127 [Pleurotus pulmonarius]